MEREQLVPKRRFKEFADAQVWERYELFEIADIIGGGTPSTSHAEYWDGNIDWYSPAEIGEQIYVDSSTKKISKLGLEKSSAKILPIGTVLFTSRAGIGNTAILAKEAATNQGFQSIVPHKNKLDSYFIYSRTHELKHYGNINGAGSTFVEVSGKQMEKMPIKLPSLEEQTKIGDFFSKLDYLVTLHQRKIEKTKALKSAYLTEMFPAKGENKPKRRFAGFTDAWEQRRLGDIATFINGRAYSQEELLKNGKYKVLRVGNFYTNSNWYYSNMELEEKYYAHAGDLLYTWSATFGPHIWLGDKVIYHYHIWRIELSEEFNKQFAVQILEYDKVNLMSNTNGSTMIHITKKGMEDKVVSLPSIAEQKKIGEFLDAIDNLITLQQRKLNKLQNLKKAYLNEMFV